MSKLDWTCFTKRIQIKSDPKTIFDSWTSQSELQRWFLKEAQFFKNGVAKEVNETIEKGDTYKWSWHGSDNVAEGEVLEIIDGKKLEFTFLGCNVTVEMKVESDFHIIHLVQSEIPTDEESRMNYYVECTRGWTFYMSNLKSILEGGIDLRNKSDVLLNVMNT